PPKISDQNKALELLGKHHKLFTDIQDMNINGMVTFNDDIN
ncbi:terminase small subunit, partial [Staphylococcus pseudintermedius]|nr:terminase small subunit [Staphylococcus pseudintermedius]